MAETILVVNAGSSSIKFQLFEIGKGDRLKRRFKGQIEGIRTHPHLIAKDPEGQVLVHGELWTAVAEGPGIPAGERVRVVHVEGLRLRVERASGQTA